MNMRTPLILLTTFLSISVAAAGIALAQSGPNRQSGASTHVHNPNHGHGMGAGMGAGMGSGMGGGMGGMGAGPVGLLTKQDANSQSDMRVVMNLVHDNTRIRRTVTRLPNGIRTLTESDDPKLAADIQVHVASMSGRLADNKEFNIFSDTLPIIFANVDKIQSRVEMTAKGVAVTRTSSEPKVVVALQKHADEVTELVTGGPDAFHRNVEAREARDRTTRPGRSAAR